MRLFYDECFNRRDGMKSLFQNEAFSFGFWMGLAFFVIINIVSEGLSIEDFRTYYNREVDIDAAAIQISGIRYVKGFPFTFLLTDTVVWFGLIADILIALAFSFLLGLGLRFISLKINHGVVK